MSLPSSLTYPVTFQVEDKSSPRGAAYFLRNFQFPIFSACHFVLIYATVQSLNLIARNVLHHPGFHIDLILSSNPSSSKYGQHYTVEEIHEIFAPQKDTVETVSAWLQESGIEAHRISQSVNKQWLQFDASVSEMEALIKAEYYKYAHYGTGKTNVACDE